MNLLGRRCDTCDQIPRARKRLENSKEEHDSIKDETSSGVERKSPYLNLKILLLTYCFSREMVVQSGFQRNALQDVPCPGKSDIRLVAYRNLNMIRSGYRR